MLNNSVVCSALYRQYSRGSSVLDEGRLGRKGYYRTGQSELNCGSLDNSGLGKHSSPVTASVRRHAHLYTRSERCLLEGGSFIMSA